MSANPLKWRPIDHLLKTTPDEYCDVALPGQDMSDRVFMLQQAERIVRSPRLSRTERDAIERVWLAEAVSRLRVAS